MRMLATVCFCRLILIASKLIAGQVLEAWANKYFYEGQRYQYSDACNKEHIPPTRCNEYVIRAYAAARRAIHEGSSYDFNYSGMLNDLGIKYSSQGN